MTGPFQVGALPPGVEAPSTQRERDLYKQALDLEGVFTEHLVSAMMASAQGPEGGSGGTAIYRQMTTQALNDALLSGGGLGLAGSLYGQLAQREGS